MHELGLKHTDTTDRSGQSLAALLTLQFTLKSTDWWPFGYLQTLQNSIDSFLVTPVTSVPEPGSSGWNKEGEERKCTSPIPRHPAPLQTVGWQSNFLSLAQSLKRAKRSLFPPRFSGAPLNKLISCRLSGKLEKTIKSFKRGSFVLILTPSNKVKGAQLSPGTKIINAKEERGENPFG